MSSSSIGVAVIGAGMAGRAHAAAYRAASTVFSPDLPEVRLVAIADAHGPFAIDAARRYGFERSETRWESIASANDIDAVSVVVANPLHREIVEVLLAAGKHVLCEKPLAPDAIDAQAMADAAKRHDRIAAVGFTYRRLPAINAIRREIVEGSLGRVTHINGRYWCDYGFDRNAPMSWRYKGVPGTGALADVGSHLVDLSEFLCGPIVNVRGTVLSTVVTDRPLPLAVAVGHGATQVGDVREPVENEDIATFTATYASGAVGTFSVSRIAFGFPNALTVEVFCEGGAATFDLTRPGEFTIADRTPAPAINGHRQVLIGPDHPYLAGGLPMDFPGVGHGQNDLFVFQARSFLEQIANIERLPRCQTFADGLHNITVLEAIVAASAEPGRSVDLAARR